MGDLLRPEHEVFCAELAKGTEQAPAWRIAFPNSQANGNTVAKEAHKLAKRPEIEARVLQLRAPGLRKNQLTVERVQDELVSILANDPRRFFREDGSLKPPAEWDDDMAAAVQSVEAVPTVLVPADGEAPATLGYKYKLRFWNKNDAIDKAMRHLGLFEKDNRQSAPNVLLQVNLVGPEPEATGSPLKITLLDGPRK